MRLANERLNALAAIARNGSFSRAAKALGITQSALSQRIQKLEDEMELTLVVRDPSRAMLTESGEKLVRHTSIITDLEEDLLHDLQSGRGELRGPVRIGAYSSVARSLVIPSLSELAKKNPELRFEVLSREMRDLPAMLRRGEVNYILLNYALDQEGIERIQLGEEENVHITPAQRPFPDVFLDHDPDDPTTHEFFRLQRKSSEKIRRSYFDDVYGIIDAVRGGLGQAVVSKHLLSKQKGVRIQRHSRAMKDPIFLHYYAAAYYMKKHEAVVSALQNRIPRLLTAQY